MPGAVEELFNNIPDASGVIAKEITANTDKFVESVRKAASDKAYSICIVIPEDYIKASIMLNRNGNINAAICSSEADMRYAKENNANVIIIKQGDMSSTAKLLDEFFKASAQPVAENVAYSTPAKSEKQQRITQQAIQEIKQEAKPSAVQESRGMLKKLKYSLGIED